MQSYIVIYQTKTKSEVYRDYLKTLSKWGRITDDSWLVVTNKTVTQIRDELDALKAQGDRIFVVKSGYLAAWVNTRANGTWLKENL